MSESKKAKGLLKSLGPGLLWAGAAIGVSHLVQSTRAGARSGFALTWAILLANLFKYPFFEAAPRYTSTTKKSLIQGYHEIGSWAFWIYIFFTLSTMFAVLAAITLVTAGLAGQIFGDLFSLNGWSAALLVFSAALLAIGRYALIDSLIKFVIVILSISTLFAVIMAFRADLPASTLQTTPLWNASGISFLISLMGWMPAPIDIAAWHSLWSIERTKQTQHQPSQSQASFDFNVGYIGTAILALGFMSLGALIMHGQKEAFSSSAIAFAGQLIALYIHALGKWAKLPISIAAFTTMFSTTLTVTDAYPRVLEHVWNLKTKNASKRIYFLSMALLIAGSLAILLFWKSGIKTLVDFATMVSFLLAPILAWMNLKVVRQEELGSAKLQGSGLVFAYLGLIFLSGFSLIYLWFKFM